MNVKVVPFAQMSRRKKRLPSFGTVLLYEDLKFGQRAWDFYEKLTRRFAGDFEFSHLMWSFSILREPESFELAARSAADAHLLILACSGTTRLPSTMKYWLEQWARLATNKPAFVTLTNQKANARVGAAMHSYLQKILTPHGIHLFPHGGSVSRVLHLE